MWHRRVPKILPVCLALRIFCSLLGTPAIAQRGSGSNSPLPDPRNAESVLHDPHRMDVSTTYRTDLGTAVLLVTVFAESTKNRLDRQAVVKLRKVGVETAIWQTTDERSLAPFTNVVLGNYEIEVSAVRYLSLQKEIPVGDQVLPAQVEIVLQGDRAAGR